MGFNSGFKGLMSSHNAVYASRITSCEQEYKFFRLKNSGNGHEDLQPAASEGQNNKYCDTHCQLCYWSALALIQAHNGPRRLECSRLLDPALNSPQSTTPTVLSQLLPECCKNTHTFIGQSKTM